MTESSLEANINTHSRPSDLRITDLRVVNLRALPFDVSLLRIDTNQGISGYGEVRDGASPTYALLLKSRLLGENPCNIDKLFRAIKQFGYHGRQGGGVCGIEMALFDLAGKAYGVPAYQLAGGKFRDKVLIYSDTDTVADGAGDGAAPQAAHGRWLQIPQNGHRHRLAKGRPGRGFLAAGRAEAARCHAPFHGHSAHRYRHRGPGRIRASSARDHRLRDSAGGRPLRLLSMSNLAFGSVKRWTNSRWPGTRT